MKKKIYHKNTSLNNTNLEEYRYLLNHSKKATPFHSLGFLKLIDDSYGNVKLKFSCVYENEIIIAMMPFFYSTKNPFRMKSSFLGCYGGYIYLEKNKEKLTQYLIKNTIHKPFSTITSFDDNMLNKTSKWKKSESSTWLIDTQRAYSEVYKDIHYKTRNQIQKSIKSNVKVTNITELDDLSQVKSIYNTLKQKHNIKRNAFSDKFFNNAFELSQKYDELIFKIAKTDNKVISFSFFIKSNTEMFYWINASSPDFLSLNGTNALLNNAIEGCCDSNVKTLNFGAVPASNKGLLHFKKRWNTYEHRYTTYTNNFFHKLKHLV